MILEQLSAVAAKHEAKAAIVSEQRTVVFAELITGAHACAARLATVASPDSTIGLLSRNPIDFVFGYLAAAQARRRLVLLDPRLQVDDLKNLMSSAEVTHLLWPRAEGGEGAPAAQGLTAEAVIDVGRDLLLARLAPTGEEASGNYQAGDFLVHTSSGSMGRPKAIVCSQENIAARISSWQKTVDLVPDDVVLCTLTLSHCHGIELLMLPSLFSGSTVIAPDLGRLSARRIASLIADHRATIFSSVPYVYETLLEGVPASSMKLDSLRYIVSASAPLSVETAKRFHDAYGRWLNQGYGLSEIGVLLFSKDGAPGHVGELVPFVEGRIEQEPGEAAGELVVRGPGMARGYLNSPEAQREMFRDGWLFTQDLMTRDASGFAIRGRRSRFVNVDGSKVDPGEVEAVLLAHPAVRDAAVVGRADQAGNERVVAYLVAGSPPPSSAVLRAHAASRIAAYKVPVEFVFIPEIPRSPLGKVQYGALTSSELPRAMSEA
jgi:acyl-CoA synthetase (AMP-forming)/AMP-acid ligase II